MPVSEEDAPGHIKTVLDLEDDETVCVRCRRLVLDGKPVLFATSYLPTTVVAGSALTQGNSGPGGIYARLAELGYRPVRFREEIRSRMSSTEESAQSKIFSKRPVVLICRTVFAGRKPPRGRSRARR
ncbi:UTRA domain-containing protein [Streptomyces chilikensis]|uniref:UTRA domain-containing protein n=1 Tax=Streptomyces chilikensis TaxID=1194079 RepID=UPI000A5B326C